MAKNSKVNQKIFYLISTLLAVVAICMIFVDVSAITKNGDSAFVLTGLQATFGYSETISGLGLSHTTVVSTFSILNLLIYVCLIVGVVLSILKLLNIAKFKSVDWVIIALFAVSALLYLFMPTFVVYGKDIVDVVSVAVKNGATKSLMVGSLIGTIASLFASFLVVAKKILAKS